MHLLLSKMHFWQQKMQKWSYNLGTISVSLCKNYTIFPKNKHVCFLLMLILNVLVTYIPISSYPHCPTLIIWTTVTMFGCANNMWWRLVRTSALGFQAVWPDDDFYSLRYLSINPWKIAKLYTKFAKLYTKFAKEGNNFGKY